MYGVEHIPELVDLSVENVMKSNPELLDPSDEASGNVEFVCGDGREGLAESGPFDCIHVGAASEKVPQTLLEQLKCPGRLIIPVGTYHQDLLQVCAFLHFCLISS